MPKSGLSYTERTLRELKNMGVMAAKAERWNPFAGHIDEKTGEPIGIREDLFGFIDIIALFPEKKEILAIQSTGPTGFYSHLKKIKDFDDKKPCAPAAKAWLESGGALELWSWQKKQVRKGGMLMRWSVRKHRFTLSDFKEKPQKSYIPDTIQTEMKL